jgi:hypothetical protein
LPKTHDAGADASLAQAKKSAAEFRKLMRAHHMHGSATRKAAHKGHTIEIKTTYEIKVDGKRLKISLAPDLDGSISYHVVPNVSFASAIDMIRCLIDAFPDDFAKGKKGTGKNRPTGGGHGHHDDHDHASHHAPSAARPVKRAGR